MKLLLLLFVIAGFTACQKNSPVMEGESDVKSFGALKRLSHQGRLLSLMAGKEESVRLLENLSLIERATLYVTTENQALRDKDSLKSLKVPFYKMTPSLASAARVESKIAIQDFQGWPQLSQHAQKLAKALSKDRCTNDFLVPFHPETQKNHPLVQVLKEQGAIEDRFLFDAYRSMSRSLFVLNSSNADLPTLFSMKMGTDTVNQRQESHKLMGLHEEVVELNDQTKKTAIPDLMKRFGISYIMDSVGIHVFKKGAQLSDQEKNYGYIIRDYSVLLQDKNYIYMPLEVFNGHVKRDSGDFVWRLDEKVELRISPEHLLRYVNDLAYETGKFQGIYLANGYGHDSFHAQNILVGLPLDPGNRAKLGFRDVGDSHDYLPKMISGIGNLEMRIANPNWCMVLRGWNGVEPAQCIKGADLAQMAGLRQVLGQIDFFRAGEDLFQNMTEVNSVYAWAEQKDHWKALIPMIETVRRSVGKPALAGKETRAVGACPMVVRQAMRACMLRPAVRVSRSQER